LGIGEQRERQLVLRRELLVRFAAVRRDAEDDRAGLLDVLPPVAEAARLLRAPGRVVLRIEVEDDVLPREVLERDGLAGGVTERELRGRLAFLNGRHAPAN